MAHRTFTHWQRHPDQEICFHEWWSVFWVWKRMSDFWITHFPVFVTWVGSSDIMGVPQWWHMSRRFRVLNLIDQGSGRSGTSLAGSHYLFELQGRWDPLEFIIVHPIPRYSKCVNNDDSKTIKNLVAVNIYQIFQSHFEVHFALSLRWTCDEFGVEHLKQLDFSMDFIWFFYEILRGTVNCIIPHCFWGGHWKRPRLVAGGVPGVWNLGSHCSRCGVEGWMLECRDAEVVFIVFVYQGNIAIVNVLLNIACVYSIYTQIILIHITLYVYYCLLHLTAPQQKLQC